MNYPILSDEVKDAIAKGVIHEVRNEADIRDSEQIREMFYGECPACGGRLNDEGDCPACIAELGDDYWLDDGEF